MEKSTHTKEYDLVRAELKAARESARLTQRALAARLDLPHSWIAKVEAGERRIDVVELCWYLAACGKQVPRVLADLAKRIAGIDGRRRGSGGRYA
jgi:transcriptional regulator with XRE-family HTH domain